MAVFDARPILAAGGEPFGEIMAAVAALAPGEELVVLAPFEPVPLEGVLSSQGFIYEAKALEGEDWEVTFRPDQAGPSSAQAMGPGRSRP